MWCWSHTQTKALILQEKKQYYIGDSQPGEIFLKIHILSQLFSGPPICRRVWLVSAGYGPNPLALYSDFLFFTSKCVSAISPSLTVSSCYLGDSFYSILQHHMANLTCSLSLARENTETPPPDMPQLHQNIKIQGGGSSDPTSPH